MDAISAAPAQMADRLGVIDMLAFLAHILALNAARDSRALIANSTRQVDAGASLGAALRHQPGGSAVLAPVHAGYLQGRDTTDVMAAALPEQLA
jgi:hypothetical protein